MEIANPSVGAVGWEGQTITPVTGTGHVFDVPQECGLHLIGLPHMGWRWPVPEDWMRLHPAPSGPSLPLPEVVMAVSGPPPTVEVRDVLNEAVESTCGPAPEDATEDAADAEATEPPVFTQPIEAVGGGAPTEGIEVPADGTEATLTVTVPDALVAMAAAAGPAGLTAGDAAAVHGKQAYNLLGKLVADGHLVKAGRGLYQHPDCAA